MQGLSTAAAGACCDPLLWRGALAPSTCARWLAAITPGVGCRLRALPAPTAAQLLQAVAGSAPRRPIEQALGASPRCNLDRSWVRHGRPPHRWHQDGALGFDFLAHAGRPLPDDALVEMLTCWIALTPCGEQAPGIEWIEPPPAHALAPAELADDAVAARFATARRVRPRFEAGDALLFDGRLLHRTHLDAAMTQPRTSIELRFFRRAGFPARLADDAWAPLPAVDGGS